MQISLHNDILNTLVKFDSNTLIIKNSIWVLKLLIIGYAPDDITSPLFEM